MLSGCPLPGSCGHMGSDYIITLSGARPQLAAANRQAVGIIPVLAAQGAGYLIAGLAVLVALRPATSEPAADPAPVPAPAQSIQSPGSPTIYVRR